MPAFYTENMYLLNFAEVRATEQRKPRGQQAGESNEGSAVHGRSSEGCRTSFPGLQEGCVLVYVCIRASVCSCAYVLVSVCRYVVCTYVFICMCLCKPVCCMGVCAFSAAGEEL